MEWQNHCDATDFRFQMYTLHMSTTHIVNTWPPSKQTAIVAKPTSAQLSNLHGQQGSFQVCLDKIGDSKEAQSFLAEGCRPLKTAFAFDSLLLRPAAAGVPPGGQTILWSVPAALHTVSLPSVTGITTSAEMQDTTPLISNTSRINLCTSNRPLSL